MMKIPQSISTITTTNPPAISAMTTWLEKALCSLELVLGRSKKRENKQKSSIDVNTTDHWICKTNCLTLKVTLYSTEMRRQPSFPYGVVDTWWRVESLETMKTSYILILLLCIYTPITYISCFQLRNGKRCSCATMELWMHAGGC